jgi:hypothetical protein
MPTRRSHAPLTILVMLLLTLTSHVQAQTPEQPAYDLSVDTSAPLDGYTYHYTISGFAAPDAPFTLEWTADPAIRLESTSGASCVVQADNRTRCTASVPAGETALIIVTARMQRTCAPHADLVLAGRRADGVLLSEKRARVLVRSPQCVHRVYLPLMGR